MKVFMWGKMLKVKDLSKKQLLDLVVEYDKYIQEANDDERYIDGWHPVCMEEFLNNEMVEGEVK